MGDFKQMKKAYNASTKILKTRMAKGRSEDLRTLEQISDNEIIIVPGQYDRIEDVFDIIKIPYGLVDSFKFNDLKLRPTQTLIINCPGDGFSPVNLEKIKIFVENGGFLWSTDWVLQNVLEKIFPEYVEYNKKPTGDDVVKVEVVDKSSPYLKGLFEDENSDPQWWLESSSYPIKILKPEEVKVLIRSREMKEKYGEDPIVIMFQYGKGTVFHMTSHYYLQRTDLRTDRHKKSAKFFATEMNIGENEIDGKEFEDLTLGEVESAYTSAQFIVNTMIERKKQVKSWKKPEKKEKEKEKEEEEEKQSTK
ncbi:MAG: hypothetical protein ACTSWY_11845 [Promethearchaeota archaeon]